MPLWVQFGFIWVHWFIAEMKGFTESDKAEEMEFPSRDDVKLWIIKNQLGRRNLSTYDRSILALKLKPVIAEKAKEQQGTRTDICQKSDKSIDTKKELAKVAGVSHDTIHKVETIEKSDNEEVKKPSATKKYLSTRIGEILLSIPKNTSYHGNQHQEVTSNGTENTKNKAEVTKEMGYTRHEVSDYQRMAQNPAVVSLVIEQAERDGRVVSHAQVMKQIKAKDAEISHDTIHNYIIERMYGRKFSHHSFIENHGLFKRYEYYGWQRTGIYGCQ